MLADGSSATGLPGAALTRAFGGGGQLDPAPLTQFKRALLQSLPPAAAAAAYARQLGLADGARFEWRPLASLHDVAIAEAAAFRELAAAGEPFILPPPVVLGAGPPLTGTGRALYVACLAEARVCGRSAFIDYGGRALLDAEPEVRAAVADRLDSDPAVLAATAEQVLLLGQAEAAGAMAIDDAFTLLGPHSWRFEAWLFDQLARYVAATQARALPPVPVLIDARLPLRQRQALHAVLRRGTEIIELAPLQIAQVRRLWCAASPAFAPLTPQHGDCLAAPPARLASLRAELARRAAPFAAPAATDGPPLFLAGDPARPCDLVNLPALAANAAARGFRVVDPQRLDFAAQVALAQSAAILVGAAPMALELAFFARPGTRLCLLHPPDTAPLLPWHALFAESGIDMTVLTGQNVDPAQPAAWRIDAAMLFGLLEGWRKAVAESTPGPGLAEPAPPAWRPANARAAQPLVSIVCAAYRHERFVGEAVRSILAQSYAPLDIVILDDASPDATADEIAAELAAQPVRDDVRFIRNPRNLGLMANFRKGLSLARGEFIVGFASDDVMQPDMVEKMVATWQTAGVSLVAANAVYIDEHGKPLNRCYTDPSGPYDDSFEALARKGFNAVCFGPAMGFERQLYIDFGFPPDHLPAEDILLPFYAYLAKGARYIPEPLLQYRLHDGNDSLGLRRERSTGTERLQVDAEMYSGHLVHARIMATELERCRLADPARFERVARRLGPLLVEQTCVMAARFADVRIELAKLAVARRLSPAAEAVAG